MVSHRQIGVRREFEPTDRERWSGRSEAVDGVDHDRRFTLVLAGAIVLVFGGAVLVFGVLVGPFVTALLCSLLLVSVVGLAVAML